MSGDDQEDREAILARRRALVAAALAGLATATGCEACETQPRTCLQATVEMTPMPPVLPPPVPAPPEAPPVVVAPPDPPEEAPPVKRIKRRPPRPPPHVCLSIAPHVCLSDLKGSDLDETGDDGEGEA